MNTNSDTQSVTIEIIKKKNEVKTGQKKKP